MLIQHQYKMLVYRFQRKKKQKLKKSLLCASSSFPLDFNLFSQEIVCIYSAILISLSPLLWYHDKQQISFFFFLGLWLTKKLAFSQRPSLLHHQWNHAVQSHTHYISSLQLLFPNYTIATDTTAFGSCKLFHHRDQ